MDKNPAFLYKVLVVGLIILFVGVGIQPAFAEISDNSVSDSDKDCNLCPKLSKLHLDRIKKLLYRIETNKNKLSLLSKFNQDIEEKYKEVSNRYSVLKKFSKDYNFYWKFPVVCSSLFILQLSLILFLFLFLFNYDFAMVDFIIEFIDALGFKLNCPWYIHPPHSL